MNLRRILFLTIALIIAVGTALGARSWVASERAAAAAAAPKVAEGPKNMVLVAAIEMPPGTFVKANNLKWQPWPEEGLLDAYIIKGPNAETTAKAQDFAGAVVRNRVLPGQPITRVTVVQPGDRSFMAAVLTPGMRAVSVPVNATKGVSGFVFPGDRVDVLLTIHWKPKKDANSGDAKRFATKTVLRDIRVLAVDQVQDNKDGKAVVAKSATLEVDPKQAERVAVSLGMGTLSLSLRSLAKQEDKMVDPAQGTLAEAVQELADVTMDLDVFVPRNLRGGTSRAGGGGSVTVLRGDQTQTTKF